VGKLANVAEKRFFPRVINQSLSDMMFCQFNVEQRIVILLNQLFN
jgi:hypothetical protein